jgi:Lrp/AsnC family transcriptional regulator for asnA, asnC and gidA
VWTNIGAMVKRNARNRLTEFDTRLIALLQVDARRPNTDLARELRVAESTVRRRIDWLRREGYIQIAAQTDPFKIGFSVWIMGGLQTELRYRDQVAEELARRPEVSSAAVTTGPFSILFTALFQSNEGLDNFLSRELGKIRGITHVATVNILRLTKRTFAYGVPAADGRMAPRDRPLGAGSDPRPWTGRRARRSREGRP